LIQGITVSGGTDTSAMMSSRLRMRVSRASSSNIKPMAARVPVGRLGTPDEVAAVVGLLASNGGAFINGQMIQVNGGAET